MNTKQRWDSALKAELARAKAKFRIRLKYQDPWERALRCCLTAQANRARRVSSHLGSKPTPMPHMVDWDVAMRIAIQNACQKTKDQLNRGGWQYALAVKVSAWRMKEKEHST